MSLITEESMPAFDLSKIGKGHLLWGRHVTWKEGKAGFVTAATKEQLIVQYHPGIGNVINHFVIPVSEVKEGQWEIRWSADLSEVQEYRAKKDNLGSGSGENEEVVNIGEKSDTGRTDL